MLQRKFYYIEDISAILGKSIAGIYGHLARKQYDAVPPPIKLGRRLAWLIEGVEDWVNAKVISAKADIERHIDFIQAPPRRRGRPTKAEEIKKRRGQQELEVLKALSQNLESEE